MLYTNTLRYDMNGRRRKKQSPKGPCYKKMKAPAFNPMHASGGPVRRDEGKTYKSAPIQSQCVEKIDDSFKKNVSKKYTVAPAYNKGAYQVVSNENIKHIGK